MFVCVHDREWIEAGQGVAIRAQMIIIDFYPRLYLIIFYKIPSLFINSKKPSNTVQTGGQPVVPDDSFL